MKKLVMAALGSALMMSGCGNKQAAAVEETADTTACEVTFIRLNVPVKVEETKVQPTIDLAKQLIEASLKDAGVMEYDMFQSETRPGYLLIYETWKDQASLDAHSAAEHFTTLVPQIQAQGEMGIEQFNQVENPEKEGKSIRINCHIVPNDPAQKEAVLKLAKELVAATQQDAGMVEYDVLSSVTRPNELMIYETWKDQASLDAHSAAEHFTRLVPQIKELASMNAEFFYQ